MDKIEIKKIIQDIERQMRSCVDAGMIQERERIFHIIDRLQEPDLDMPSLTEHKKNWSKELKERISAS